MAALKTHQIDGMIVEVNAGYRLEEEEVGRVLVQFGDLIKTFHIYVLYAHKDFAAKNPAAVKAFLAGWFETIDWMQKNRDKTIEIVQRKTNVSKALATRDYDELRGMFSTHRQVQSRGAQGALALVRRDGHAAERAGREQAHHRAIPAGQIDDAHERGRNNDETIRNAAPERGHAAGRTTSAAADKLDEIKARGKLLVGVSETSPPFSSRENGKFVGYDVDLAARVAKRLGVPMEFVPVINRERIPALQQDRIDLAASGMTRADNRRHLIGFSLAYLISPHTVHHPQGQRHHRRQADGGQEARAGARSRASTRSSRQRCRRMEIEFFDDYAACFKALAEKRVSGFLADEVLLWAFAYKSGAPQDYMMIPDYDLPRTAGFAIKKDEPRFTEFVDQTLLDLEKSGEAQKIFNAWFAPVKRPFTIKRD